MLLLTDNAHRFARCYLPLTYAMSEAKRVITDTLALKLTVILRIALSASRHLHIRYLLKYFHRFASTSILRYNQENGYSEKGLIPKLKQQVNCAC